MDFSHCEKDALITECKTYRYRLSRIWDRSQPSILFVMLNPSYADEQKDDKTIKRCLDFANSWGYGSLYVGNLFAFRSRDPKELYKCSAPVGNENDTHLVQMAKLCDKVIFAWGNDGLFLDRNRIVSKLLPDSYCLGQTNLQQPKHPLYVSGDVQPTKYE